jgi:hypothetical protein
VKTAKEKVEINGINNIEIILEYYESVENF